MTKMNAVVFFHHGFGDHSGFCAQELMVTLAKLYNFGCICCDMPGMGRSDGQFTVPRPKR